MAGGTNTYRARIWSNRDGKRIAKAFPTMAAAKTWRRDSQKAVEQGTMRPPTRQTVEEAMTAWLEGARAGLIRNRSGDPYKPSAIRSYERNYRLRVRDRLGHFQLTDVRRTDLQDFIDAMQADELAASTIDCTLNPLRAIYRRALARGGVAENPTSGLEIPRAASDGIGSRRLTKAPVSWWLSRPRTGPIWATAMYAGLRRGELMALAPTASTWQPA